jgi:hypothetical protein
VYKAAVLELVKVCALITIFFISETRKHDQSTIRAKPYRTEFVVYVGSPTADAKAPPINLASPSIDDSAHDTFRAASPTS